MLKNLMRVVHQSYFVIAFVVSVIVGIIIALVFRINFFISPFWILCAAGLLIFTYFKPKIFFITLAILAGFIVSFFRVALELKGESYIHGFLDQEIIVTGTVAGDPDIDDDTIKIKIKNLQFNNLDSFAGSLYLSLSNISSNQQISRSDTITVKGKLLNGFGTYAGYLYKPTVLKIEHPVPGDLILKLRNWFASRVTQELPSTESSLGLSYLLGMKTGLDERFDENLRIVGLIHIVVASGTHLSILVSVARKIFGRLSRFAGLFFSILFILFFMTMVGFTPSILRAGIMSILTLLAWYVGRKFAPWRIILIVAGITLIINPMFIVDLGWLLSFASFAGIMVLSPRLVQFFYHDKKPGFIGNTIITTLSATLMTFPITLYYFGSISLISLLANVIILPTLPCTLAAVFFTGVFSGVPFLSSAASFIAANLLKFHITVVEFFAGESSFLVKIAPYNPHIFLCYFFIIIPFAVGLIRKKMIKLKQLRY